MKSGLRLNPGFVQHVRRRARCGQSAERGGHGGFDYHHQLDVEDVPKAQLSADHLSVSLVPLVVADCAPPPRVKDLHATFKVFLPANQSQRRAAA